MQKHLTSKLSFLLIIAVFCHLFIVRGQGLPADAFDWMIVTEVRLPRTLLGLLTGFVLALTGAVFQTIFSNKLADSFTLGIAGGASLGSAIGVVLGVSAAGLSITGSLMTLVIVIVLTQLCFRSNQRIGMVLFGMFINFFCSSALYGLVIFWPGRTRQLLNYLFGSIGTAGWQDIAILLPVTVFGTIGLLMLSRAVSIVANGETIARGVGVNDRQTTYIALTIASVMTAVLISMTGIIGFVGLIIPQLFNGIKKLLTIGLMGGLSVIMADFLGNNMITPIQLPVSVPLSLAGLPLLLMIILKKGYGGER